MIVLDKDADILYVSETVESHVGLTQVSYAHNYSALTAFSEGTSTTEVCRLVERQQLCKLFAFVLEGILNT